MDLSSSTEWGSDSAFSKVMNLVLRGVHWNSVLAFLDDFLVLGKDLHEHLSNIKDVLERFRSYGLNLKPKKTQKVCAF